MSVDNFIGLAIVIYGNLMLVEIKRRMMDFDGERAIAANDPTMAVREIISVCCLKQDLKMADLRVGPAATASLR